MFYCELEIRGLCDSHQSSSYLKSWGGMIGELKFWAAWATKILFQELKNKHHQKELVVFQHEDITDNPKEMLMTSIRSSQTVPIYWVIALHSINIYDYVLIKKSKNAAKEISVGLVLCFQLTTLICLLWVEDGRIHTRIMELHRRRNMRQALKMHKRRP